MSMAPPTPDDRPELKLKLSSSTRPLMEPAVKTDKCYSTISIKRVKLIASYSQTPNICLIKNFLAWCPPKYEPSPYRHGIGWKQKDFNVLSVA